MPDQGEVGAGWLRLLGFCPLQRFLYLPFAGLPTFPGHWHRGMCLSHWASFPPDTSVATMGNLEWGEGRAG